MRDVLVIGDIILDKYWHGSCNRISPEAPVPILNFESERFVPGGAGNVALNVSEWGSSSSIIGGCGRDSDGRHLKEIFKRYKISNQIIYSSSFQTISKYRVMEGAHHLIRIDFEDSNQIINENRLMQKFLSNLNNHRVILISDYGKGALSRNSIKKIIKEAGKHKKPVIIDPKGGDFEKYKGAFLLTPNRSEFEEIVGKCSNYDELLTRGVKLKRDLNLENLAITLGSDGMLLITKKGIKKISSQAKKVFDVSGAGDTVISIVAAEIAAGNSIEDAIELANKAAGIVVGKPGTATTNKAEVLTSVGNHVISLNSLIALRQQLENEGKKLVMTNGCFDIMHSGHVGYLKEAKKLGDVLVVALNGDLSVKKLKGNARPVNKFEDRASVLLGLKSVDYVIKFDRDTPAQIYNHVIPHVLVKGGDYKNKRSIIGYDVVTANKGEVKILNLFKGKSTSAIIQKILGNNYDNN